MRYSQVLIAYRTIAFDTNSNKLKKKIFFETTKNTERFFFSPIRLSLGCDADSCPRSNHNFHHFTFL